jgi:hypothetical protein
LRKLQGQATQKWNERDKPIVPVLANLLVNTNVAIGIVEVFTHIRPAAGKRKNMVSYDQLTIK